MARSCPRDVARVESRTFICTADRRDAVNVPRGSAKGQLGNWMSPADADRAIGERFPGCMEGRTMYVIPFSMGPLNSPYSKIGVQLTDSAYVVCSMRVMTRMGAKVLEKLESSGDGYFVKALHSVGRPVDGAVDGPRWPCDADRTIILHKSVADAVTSRLPVVIERARLVLQARVGRDRQLWQRIRRQLVAGQKVLRPANRLVDRAPRRLAGRTHAGQ